MCRTSSWATSQFEGVHSGDLLNGESGGSFLGKCIGNVASPLCGVCGGVRRLAWLKLPEINTLKSL
jgi:hypothetical protein